MREDSSGCRWCRRPTKWIKRRKRHKVFCSRECDSLWRAEKLKGNTLRSGLKPACTFPPGHSPWNKGLRGIHLSPATEFKPGRKSDANKLPVGSVTIRTCTGVRTAWVKVADPNKWRPRAVVEWERINEEARPEGCVIRHDNRDTLNDDPDNLVCATRAEHLDENVGR